MKFSRSQILITFGWVFFVGSFVLLPIVLPAGEIRSSFSDIFQCLIPLFANTCLLWNAATPYRRRNTFWMLLAMGCTLWLFGHLMFTYWRVVRHGDVHFPFSGDILFFLHLSLIHIFRLCVRTLDANETNTECNEYAHQFCELHDSSGTEHALSLIHI